MSLLRLIEECLRPPLVCLLIVVGGLLLRRRRPRLGRTLWISGLSLLWLLSTPMCGGALLGALQDSPALALDGFVPEAEAIVVLSAEFAYAPEYRETTVGPTTLQRIRYAAALHRRTGLPVLVSGGSAGTGLPTLAAMMRRTLEEDFHVPVRWSEDESADTWENAVYSAQLLQRDGIHRILLVTSAWHMPRAMQSFATQGMNVTAAPTAFRGPAFQGIGSLVPSASGMRDSSLAFHELLGLVWYSLRGR